MKPTGISFFFAISTGFLSTEFDRKKAHYCLQECDVEKTILQNKKY